MRRFLRDKELRIMDFPDEHNEFQSLLSESGTESESESEFQSLAL